MYLNRLDYFTKQTLKEKFYIRYVDDIVILGKSAGALKGLIPEINRFLKKELEIELNLDKIKFKNVSAGIDFLGYFVKPDYTLVRRRVVKNCKEKIRPAPEVSKKLVSQANSYLGHFIHAASYGLRKMISERLIKADNSIHFSNGYKSIFAIIGGQRKIIKTAVAAAVLLAGFSFAHSASAAYFKTGSLVSANLLDGLTNVGAITQFNATTSIAAGTSVSVQFSRNKLTWYSASGTAFATSSLSDGANSIDLSALGWTGPIFYYKLQFATNDSSITPTVSGVAVNYNYSSGPTYEYFGQGSLVSANVLDGHTDVGAITGFSASTTVPASTTITVQFSRDKLVWYNHSGVAYAEDSLSNGSNVVNLSALNWTGPLIYYKLHFTTSDVGQTAAISSAEIDYSAGSGSVYFKQGTLVSTNLLAGGGTLSGNELFGYNISSLPSGTTVQVQFSTSSANWFSSTGTAWAWDTLSSGSHLTASTAINLSALGWTGASFYYKLEFTTTDAGTTPTVAQISLFTPGALPIVTVLMTVVSSSAPIVSAVSVNGGNSITLTPATTTPISVNFTVTDYSGCSNVFTSGNVTTTLYRMGVGSSCVADNRNCYRTSSQTNNCSGSGANATATLNLYYFADSTGSQSPTSSYPSDHWQAYVQALDGTANATGTATSTVNDVNVLTAITVTTSSINYGTMSPNATTSAASDQLATVQNVGNSSTTLKISGTALVMSSPYDAFATSSQHYATSTFQWNASGPEQQLQQTQTTVPGFSLTTPTSTSAVSGNTYRGVQIPGSAQSGVHVGMITFSSNWSQ